MAGGGRCKTGRMWLSWQCAGVLISYWLASIQVAAFSRLFCVHTGRCGPLKCNNFRRFCKRLFLKKSQRTALVTWQCLYDLYSQTAKLLGLYIFDHCSVCPAWEGVVVIIIRKCVILAVGVSSSRLVVGCSPLRAFILRISRCNA